MRRHTMARWILLLMSLALGAPAFGVTPATLSGFTYQGYLKDGNAPANGTYDFKFQLFTLVAGGSQVGSDVLADDATVSDGRFTVDLGFPASAFNGSDRFLAIGVRPGSSTGAYTDLTPRQKINPTPYALRAQNASTLQGLTGSQYVKIAGDTMTGLLTVNAAALPMAVSTTATTTALSGEATSSSTLAAAVRGTATAGTGTPAGVEGKAGWFGGIGVRGLAGSATATDHPAGYYSAGGEFYGPNGVIGVGTAEAAYGYGAMGVTRGAHGRGVYGSADGTTNTAYGVYGFNASPTGWAGYFDNSASGGVALQAAGSGIIRSTANTEVTFSPHALVPASPTTAVTISRNMGGSTSVTSTATGAQTVYLPLQLPALLYGNRLKVKSLEVSYHTSNASSYIAGTYLRVAQAAGEYSEMISDGTDRTSTTWRTYTLTETYSSAIDGCCFLRFPLQFANVGDTVYIGLVKLVLVGD
jgi:hypothetical protein